MIRPVSFRTIAEWIESFRQTQSTPVIIPMKRGNSMSVWVFANTLLVKNNSTGTEFILDSKKWKAAMDRMKELDGIQKEQNKYYVRPHWNVSENNCGPTAMIICRHYCMQQFNITMKKLAIISNILFVVALLTAGCSKNVEDVQNGSPVTVSLNLSGEFDVSVTQDSLTKATASDDAYGINVYYDKEGDGETNDIYAYGIFDNVADMSITMLSNHKYRVCCTLIKDGRKTLYFGQAFNNAYSGYCYPFQTNTSGSTLLNNKFIIGTSSYLSGMGSGDAHIISTTSPSASNATHNASVNRFYGETDQYTPVPNGTIEIFLKRVVFGAKFVVTGVKEGNLRVICGEFYDKTYNADDPGTETIYSFTDTYTCWQKETPLKLTIGFTYTSDRGTLWNITQTQEIVFKRNIMTTVNITLKPDLSGGLFDFVEEPMDDDNDIDMGINTDGLIDIVVDPTK